MASKVLPLAQKMRENEYIHKQNLKVYIISTRRAHQNKVGRLHRQNIIKHAFIQLLTFITIP